jgi:hypothetical protein
MVSDQVNNVFLVFNNQNGFRTNITSLSSFYNRERIASMGLRTGKGLIKTQTNPFPFRIFLRIL